MNHQFYNRDDGLLHCKICGGAEASLPTDCPKIRLTSYQEELIMQGELDFVNNNWTPTFLAPRPQQQNQ